MIHTDCLVCGPGRAIGIWQRRSPCWCSPAGHEIRLQNIRVQIRADLEKWVPGPRSIEEHFAFRLRAVQNDILRYFKCRCQTDPLRYILWGTRWGRFFLEYFNKNYTRRHHFSHMQKYRQHFNHSSTCFIHLGAICTICELKVVPPRYSNDMLVDFLPGLFYLERRSFVIALFSACRISKNWISQLKFVSSLSDSPERYVIVFFCVTSVRF